MDSIKVKRHPERGKYDLDTIYGILDQGMVCHVAFAQDGVQFNIPMLYVRIGNELFLHGSMKSRIYSTLVSGADTCISVTILDGVVVAKSAYNCSMNYRSASIYGKISPVQDQEEKIDVMKKLVEKMIPGRWDDCRKPNMNEVDVTGIMKISIDKFSSKVREGEPIDNEADLGLPHWTGVIPLSITSGNPITSGADNCRLNNP